MKNIILNIWYSFGFLIFRLFPIKNNRIVVQNFFGKGYGDNPKAIIEELISKYEKEFEIVWLVKKQKYKMPDIIKQVERGTIKELYYLYTSKIWIDNSRKHLGIKKRKNQFYIQTWHGDLALKKVEGDTIEKLDKNYIKTAINDSKMINVITSGSKFFTDMVRRAFWYNGEILECGSPRTDVIFKNEDTNIINNNESCNIALYAPTFRDDNDESVFNIDYKKLINSLNKNSLKKWKLYVRFHPNVSYLQKKVNYDNDIIDGSKINDMNTLLKHSSLLITDYSSSMFDAMYANVPTLLYIPDIIKYEKSRGTYFKMDELPFKKAYTLQELYESTEKLDINEFENKYKSFLNKIGSFEKGVASQTVANLIYKVASGGKN